MTLRIPPPLLFLLCLSIISMLPNTLFANTTNTAFLWCAGLLCLIGLSIAFLSLFAFWQAKTTLNPKRLEHTSFLVTTGVFRLSRNPMYLSLALWLSAWSLFCETLWGFLIVIAFVSYLTAFQIKPEEKFLTQKFGQPYLDYKQSVRRWI